MTRILTLATILISTATVAGGAHAGKDVSIRDLPEPVKRTLFRETRGGLLQDIERLR